MPARGMAPTCSTGPTPRARSSRPSTADEPAVALRTASALLGVEGEAGAPVAVVSLPARGRPPQAAARRAGLEFVEKLLTDSMLALLDGRHAADPSGLGRACFAVSSVDPRLGSWTS